MKRTPFIGGKGPFVVSTGSLAGDVLDWLCEDPLFAKRGAALKAADASLDAEGGTKWEMGIKSCKVTGAIAAVNGLPMKLNYARLQNWLAKLKSKNMAAFQAPLHVHDMLIS